jgi:hypothetical protein
MPKKNGRKGSAPNDLTPGLKRGPGGRVVLVDEDLALEHAAANGYVFDCDKYRPSSVQKRTAEPAPTAGRTSKRAKRVPAKFLETVVAVTPASVCKSIVGLVKSAFNGDTEAIRQTLGLAHQELLPVPPPQ